MHIATFNIEYGMNDREVQRAGRLVREAGVGIGGAQELRDQHSRDAFKKGLGRGYGVATGGQCPIYFRKNRWEVIDHEYRPRVIKGLGGVTPDLPINIATFRDRRARGIVFDVINCHNVPLTLGGERRKDHYAWRDDQWDHYWSQVDKEVDERTAKGRTVFVLGDFNDIRMKNDKIKGIDAKAKWLRKTPLDLIFVVQRGVIVTETRETNFGTGSDHAGRGSIVRLNGRL